MELNSFLGILAIIFIIIGGIFFSEDHYKNSNTDIF